MSLRTSFALIVSVSVALAFSASAWADLSDWGTTAQITRADASPDWTHGSIAGSVSDLPPQTHHVWDARAYVAPNGSVCQAKEFPFGLTRIVWESSEDRNSFFTDRNPSFDIPDVLLNIGISPRLCLYGIFRYFGVGQVLDRTLLATRLFTVPPPVPPPPGQKSEVTLSRGTAFSKARSALKKRFGTAYKRGKRKRLRCSKRSSTRYRCTFSFRHRKKRQHGTVTVAIKPNGSVTTKIKRG
jgi:hypothetical protein